MNQGKVTIVDIDEWLGGILNELPYFLESLGLSIRHVEFDSLDKYYRKKVNDVLKEKFKHFFVNDPNPDNVCSKLLENQDQMEYDVSQSIDQIRLEWLAKNLLISYINDTINETLHWCKASNDVTKLIFDLIKVKSNVDPLSEKEKSDLDEYLTSEDIKSELNDSFMQAFDFILLNVTEFILNHLDKNHWRDIYLIVKYNTVFLSDLGDYRINYFHRHLENDHKNKNSC